MLFNLDADEYPNLWKIEGEEIKKYKDEFHKVDVDTKDSFYAFTNQDFVLYRKGCCKFFVIRKTE